MIPEWLIQEIEGLHKLAYESPELNLANYSHDEVIELNAAMCELFYRLDHLIDIAKEPQQ